MSCLNLHVPKKLKQLPSSSKKAWKSLTSTLQPKLRHLRSHLRIPTSVTRTARRLLLLRPKRHPARMGGLSYYRRQQYQYQYQHLQQSSSLPPSPATVYVDRLFGESLPSSSSSRTQTAAPASTSAGGGGKKANKDHEQGNEDVPEQRRSRKKEESEKVRWKEYASSLPVIRGVDDRAEEFISKFREEMQLQREQSLVEFQQMLARTA